MSKVLRIAAIGAMAAAAMYLLDPDRGRSRRARLGDQAEAVARRAGERAKAQVEYQKGVVQGLAHDVTEPFRPTPEFDDHTLVQKVRSEALGRWAGRKKDIEIDVENGVVTLHGTADPDQVGELVRLVESVPGVTSVVEELTTTQRS